MTVQISPERLAEFEAATLASGNRLAAAIDRLAAATEAATERVAGVAWSEPILYRGTDPLIDTEYLLTIWPSGGMDLAMRPTARQSVTWSPAVALTVVTP